MASFLLFIFFLREAGYHGVERVGRIQDTRDLSRFFPIQVFACENRGAVDGQLSVLLFYCFYHRTERGSVLPYYEFNIGLLSWWDWNDE